jgi:hypothetical protein
MMAKTRIMLWFYQLSLLILRAFMVKPGGDLTWAIGIRGHTSANSRPNLRSINSKYKDPLQRVHNRTVDTLTYRITRTPA